MHTWGDNFYQGTLVLMVVLGFLTPLLTEVNAIWLILYCYALVKGALPSHLKVIFFSLLLINVHHLDQALVQPNLWRVQKVVEFQTVAEASRSKYGYISRIKVHQEHQFLYTSSPIAANQVCQGLVQFNPRQYRYDALEPDWERQQLSLGPRYTLALKELYDCRPNVTLRGGLLQRLQLSELTDEARALVMALALGDDSDLPSSLKEQLLQSQLVHLFVVSGAHLAFVSLLVWWPMQWWVRWHWLSFGAAMVVVWAACLAYGALTGLALPVLRALFALTVALWVHHRWCWGHLQSLSLVALLLLVAQPMLWTQLSFIFSFLFTALVLASLGAGSKWRLYLRLQGLFFVSMALIALFWPTPWNLFGWLINILMMPLVAFWMLPLSLLVTFWPADVWVALANFSAEALQWLWGYSAQGAIYPSHTLNDASLMLFIVWLALVRFSLLRLTPLLVIAMVPFWWPVDPQLKSGEFDLLTVDVGQGQAHILRVGQQQWLYDVGDGDDVNNQNAKLLLRHLRQYQGEISVVLSHHDRDHYGAWLHMAPWLQPKEALIGQRELNSVLAPDQGQLCHGLQRQASGVQLRFLTAPEGWLADNNRSCSLLVDSPFGSLLLAGDSHHLRELQLLREADLPQVDTLVFSHHGSATSSSDAWLTHLAPKFGVISAGRLNPYGHPHQGVMDRAQRQGIQVFRTQECGSLLWQVRAQGQSWRCQSDKARRWQSISFWKKSL